MAILKYEMDGGYPRAAITMGKIKPRAKNGRRPVVWQKEEGSLWVVCTECCRINKITQRQTDDIDPVEDGNEYGDVLISDSPSYHWYLGCVVCRYCEGHVFYTLVGMEDPRAPKKVTLPRGSGG